MAFRSTLDIPGKRAVIAALAAALALAACSDGSEADKAPKMRDARPGAVGEFRTALADAYARLDPQCPITKAPDLVKWYDPPKIRMMGVEANTPGTPFDAVKKSEKEALAKRPPATCPAPDGPGAKDRVDKDVQATEADLGKLETILRDYLTAGG